MPGGLHPPLEEYLSRPIPNYADPITRPRTVLIIACVGGPITMAILFARLWVRMAIQRNVGWDDWLMAAAIVPIATLMVVFPYVTEVVHFNKHVWDVRPESYVLQRKWVLVIETVFIFASGLIKISILLFYRRLSSRAVSTPFRWVTWICIGFIAGFTIAFTMVPIFGCQPISAFWDQVNIVKIATGYEYRCFNEGADVFAAGVISAVQDLITAILPTFIYWRLQIPLRQKMALFGIFAIGYGVVAIGAARAYFSWNLFFETYDVTWYAWQNYLWTLLELQIGVICANAPALKVFLRHALNLEWLPGRSGSRSTASSSNNGSNPRSSKSTRALRKLSLSFWRNHGVNKDHGLLPEPNRKPSANLDAAVLVQKDFGISHSPMPFADRTRNSVHGSEDLLNSQFDEDVEMESMETDLRKSESRSARDEEEVLPLPPVPSQPPTLARANNPRVPPAVHVAYTNTSLGPFPRPPH